MAMSKRWRLRILYSFLTLISLAVVALLWLFLPPHWFSLRISPFDDVADTVSLKYSPLFHFDIGTVDVNNDSFLDIFTVNCFCQQSLLVNQGDGSYTDELAIRGLSHNPETPYFECTVNPGSRPGSFPPGIHIYNVAYGPRTVPSSVQVVHWKKGGEVDRISGVIELHSAVRMIEAWNTSVDTSREIASASLWKHRLAFEGKPSEDEGRIVFYPSDPPIFAINYRYQLFVNDGSRPEHIYLGKEAVTPRDSQFLLTLGDRHGFAWADYNKDGSVDLFIARGGMKGRLAKYQEVDNYNDEVFRQDAGKFNNVIESTGIKKNGHRGRQSMWVDVNQDGCLDLYLVNYKSKNQLYMNQGDGTFIDVAREKGLDLVDGDVAAWLDYDKDGDMDMVVGGKRDEVYNNQRGIFRRVVLKKTGRNCLDLTLGDYDNDLDLDLLVMHRDPILGGAGWGSAVLYENVGGEYLEVEPGGVCGFPNRGMGACWIDYDNDGLQDIYMAGEGLFRNSGDGSYEKTRLLSDPALLKKQLVKEVFHWFDHNNDGFQDAVIVREYGGLCRLGEKLLNKFGLADRESWVKFNNKMNYSFRFHENHIRQGNWISILLQGTASNREGIGCKLLITAGDLKQYREVGFNGRVYRSQSRRRIIFGLDQNELIDEIKVQWPGGIEQILSDVAPNKLLTISEPLAESTEPDRLSSSALPGG